MLLSLGMAPELTRLAAKLVEGKYHLLLHLYESSTSCVTVTSIIVGRVLWLILRGVGWVLGFYAKVKSNPFSFILSSSRSGPKVQVMVLVKVQCPIHGLGSSLNSDTQNSVSNSQKKGPGETL